MDQQFEDQIFEQQISSQEKPELNFLFFDQKSWPQDQGNINAQPSSSILEKGMVDKKCYKKIIRKEEEEKAKKSIQRCDRYDLLVRCLLKNHPRKKQIFQKIFKIIEGIKGEIVQKTNHKRSGIFIFLMIKILPLEQKKKMDIKELKKKLEKTIERKNTKRQENQQQKLIKQIKLIQDAIEIFLEDEMKGIQLFYTKGEEKCHGNSIKRMQECKRFFQTLNQRKQLLNE